MPIVDTKISLLPPTALILGTEVMPVVQGGATKGAKVPYQSDTSGSAPKIGFGGAVDDTARVAITNSVSRDGQGSGAAWAAEITRSVDVNPSTTNPLNHGVRLSTTIQSGVTQAVREWGFTAIVEDLSGLANAVAMTGQGHRHGPGAAVWSAQFNTLDEANPALTTRNAYGFEANVQADGDDANGMRYIGYSVAKNVADVHTGVVGQHRHGYGYVIRAQSADLYFGLQIDSPGAAEVDVGISLKHQGRRGIEITSALTEYGILITGSATETTAAYADASTSQHGFYAEGAYSTAAFRMLENNWFNFGADTGGAGDQVRMRFNAGTRKIEFYLGTTRVGYIDITTADHAL